MNIGKYKVLGLLGKGGMGRVYKAELPRAGRTVALKLLRPHEHMVSILGRSRAEDMFMNEARIIGRLCHPNVAAILDFDRDIENRPFFTMEYHCMNLGSMTGEHYMIEAPARVVDPANAFRYAYQLLSGLDRLHHAGILHRDIKPYNLLVTDEDEVKIIDFGLSLLRGEVQKVPGTFKIGTPYYAAPELEEDPEGADERADLYAAGVVIWRMLTGFLPPESGERSRPGEINGLLGKSWDDFLAKAVHQEKTKRFQDCRRMQEALKASYEDWHNSMEQACRLQPLARAGDGDLQAGKTCLRSRPLKVRARDAAEVFGLDSLNRPLKEKAAEFVTEKPEVVRDLANGLLWQREGTRYPVDWKEAFAYIKFLNENAFAGIRAWRLPTIDELLVQVRRASILGDYCAPQVFDPGRRRLWSADRKTFTSAWFVDTVLGFAGPADFTCPCHVRAVSHGSP